MSAVASPVITDTAVRTVAFAARNRPRRGTAARHVWSEPVEYSYLRWCSTSGPLVGSDRWVPGLGLPRADHRSHRPDVITLASDIEQMWEADGAG